MKMILMMAAASALAMVSMTPAATAATEHIAAPASNYAVTNNDDAPATGADNMLLTTRAGLADRPADGSIDITDYSMPDDTSTIAGALTST